MDNVFDFKNRDIRKEEPPAPPSKGDWPGPGYRSAVIEIGGLLSGVGANFDTRVKEALSWEFKNAQENDPESKLATVRLHYEGVVTGLGELVNLYKNMEQFLSLFSLSRKETQTALNQFVSEVYQKACQIQPPKLKVEIIIDYTLFGVHTYFMFDDDQPKNHGWNGVDAKTRFMLRNYTPLAVYTPEVFEEFFSNF